MLDLLMEEKREGRSDGARRYEYVFWIDADAIVTEMDTRVEDVLPLFLHGFSLVGSVLLESWVRGRDGGSSRGCGDCINMFDLIDITYLSILYDHF